MCPCLQPLDHALKQAGFKETFRGQAWSDNCREWVYYPVVLDKPAVRSRFALPTTVIEHEHLGTHDGAESGFVCVIHADGVMGLHPEAAGTHPAIFSPAA